jgi:UDP-N-acetylmuramoyl-L-alanyl-D-glutamate--2,6-diaminopimelate ligase
MQFWQLLEGITGVRLGGDPATAIRGLVYDSRLVEPGYLFAAVRGLRSDGNDFIQQAIDRGAVAVLTSRPGERRPGGVAWAQVEDDRLALALASRNYYGRPDERMSIVGVTGTNGKTTLCFLLESVLKEAALKPCLLGTVLYRYDREEVKAARTTPESLDLYRLLDRFATAGARSCAMEVSSHALVQKRVAGLRFKVGVFTNLTQDHLDFHRTMEDYLEAKTLLFRGLPETSVAVLNADDSHADHMRAATRARVLTFGESAGADVRLVSRRSTIGGTEVSMAVAAGVIGPGSPASRLEVRSALLGRPNSQNLCAATAAALAFGVPLQAIARGLEAVRGVAGRFERIEAGQPFEVLVDYAHTDDALRTLLRSVRELRPRRIVTVFGCGGDRDRSKRPLMGFAAAAESDIVIVTSDNPRSENPMGIIEEILPGVRRAQAGDERGELDPGRCLVIPDRKEAIRRALSLAAERDFVVIAGKGHEASQILGDRTVPFDDREIARDLLRLRADSSRGHAAQ